ncbi:MAG: T9SS type A sorting domain-containing protein [Bacteroidia bacterium]
MDKSLVAQSMANYAVTRATGITYSSIAVTGSPLPGWRNGGANALDDNRSNATSIGFDFWYDGTRYTKFSISTNGFLDLSANAASGTGAGAYGNTNSQFTASPTGTYLALAPLYCNLQTQSGTASLPGSIVYLVSGAAPNRILTLEWIAMTAFGNTTPNLNFQVNLHETTGIIDYVYGTMTPGTFAFAYSCGINASAVSAAPTVSQLKMQQMANTTTFSNAIQNSLSTLPATNSRLTFTPPAPANPATVLSFTAVASTSMTLNWANWAPGNLGYVIYKSTDNINFTFVTQTVSNATTQAVAGLLPSTLYYWNVYAVKEGTLSTALTGSRSTTAGANKVSAFSGNWNTALTWNPIGVPALGDNVTIASGNTVTLDGTNNCNSLTINGTLKMGSNTTARSLTVSTNITVNSSGLLEANPSFAATHTLSIGGNLTNNGNINLAPNATSLCNTIFTQNGNVTLSGTGISNKFNRITINLGSSINNILDITSTNFSAATNFLILTNGTLRISTINAVNVNAFSAAGSIGTTCGLILNSSTAIVNTTGGSTTLSGQLTINSGTLNIGNALNNDLLCTGGTFSINGGAVVIAGKYYVPNTSTLANFTMTTGTLTLATVGSNVAGIAPFNINSPGSKVNISGGTIVIQRGGGAANPYQGYINNSTTSVITGGTLQIGNASTPAGETIYINTNAPVGNLRVNNSTVLAKLNTNALTVNGNVNITLGTLVSNNLNITVGGNWTDAGTFTPGTGTVTFNGTLAQSITKASGETFYSLIFSNAGSKTLGGAISVAGNLTINSGATLDVSTNNYAVSVKGAWSNSGVFNAQQGTVTLNGTLLQNIAGTGTTALYNLTLNNAAGARVNSGSYTISNALIATSGQLNNASAGSFTLLSNAASSAYIGNGAGSFAGTFQCQRWTPNPGQGNWADIGTTVSNNTVNDWDAQIYISGVGGRSGTAGGFNSFTLYSEPLTANNYTAITATSYALSPGVGYTLWLADTYSPATWTPQSITSNGTPNSGSVVSPALTYTGGSADPGQNHVANPFASHITWDASGVNITKAGNVDLSTIYVISNGNYVPQGNGFDLPAGQGFIVYSTGVGANSISFRQNCKNTSTASTFDFRMAAPYNLKLKLSSSALPGLFHEVSVNFNENATLGFESPYDAHFIKSPVETAPGLCMVQNGIGLTRNTFNALEHETVVIPIKCMIGLDAMYKLESFGAYSMSEYSCVLLEDRQTRKMIDLKKVAEYNFQARISDSPERFVLHLTRNGSTCEQLLAQVNAGSGFPSANAVTIENQEGGAIVKFDLDQATNATISVYNMLGQKTTQDISFFAFKENQTMNFNSSPSGMYLITVNLGGIRTITKKIFVNR